MSIRTYYFTQELEWICFYDDSALIGLTSLAKKEIGLISNIEIHMVGKSLSANQVFGRVRTDKYVCKLIMPVNGKVVEANTFDYNKLNMNDKELDINEWIVKITMNRPLISGTLFTLEEYRHLYMADRCHVVKYLSRIEQ